MSTIPLHQPDRASVRFLPVGYAQSGDGGYEPGASALRLMLRGGMMQELLTGRTRLV